MTRTLKVAAAQYEIGQPGDFIEFAEKIKSWVESACALDARLLVFPEYFSMELAHTFPTPARRSLGLQLQGMQALLGDFIDLFKNLASAKNIYIVAGSYPVLEPDGCFRNRSYLFDPQGRMVFQDKIQMTRFENEIWKIEAGNALKVFETDIGCIGINICYDSEFPMLARTQVEQGADLIVVPSCTDTVAGYWRVRIGCQARALENQCYVVQSPTVGLAPWSEAIDVNIGAAAIYTPVDYGFPDNGVLAIGCRDQSEWVVAELDLESSAKIRQTGQVFNHRDWPSQFRPLSRT